MVSIEFEPTPEPGSYVGTLSSVESTEQDFGDGPKVRLAWSFVVELPDGNAEMTYWTSDKFTPRTNAGKLVLAILGKPPEPGSTPEDLIGGQALIVVDLGADGFAKVADVVARPRGSK